MVLFVISANNGWYVRVKVGQFACVQCQKLKQSKYKHNDILTFFINPLLKLGKDSAMKVPTVDAAIIAAKERSIVQQSC